MAFLTVVSIYSVITHCCHLSLDLELLYSHNHHVEIIPVGHKITDS